MKKLKKILLWILSVGVGAYALTCLLIYTNPQLFFYNPTKVKSELSHAHQYGYPGKEVHYTSADGTPLIAWMTKPHSAKNKMIVFMHGNSYNIEEFYHKLITFAQAGYGTFLPEYRGFGDVKGKITQKNLEADAEAAIHYLHQAGYRNKDIYIYGMSLGSHMATHTTYTLQAPESFAGLILEVPFDSLKNVVRLVVPLPLPLEFIMTDKYDNVAMIEKIKSPILIMGGTIDPTIPVELAQNLYEHAPQPKQFIMYQNGKHSNLFNFRNDLDILKWINSQNQNQ